MGKARLGEKAVDASAQIVVVAPGILLESWNMFCQPDLLLEMVAKDLQIDLGRAAEFVMVDFACEPRERLAL